MEKVTFLYSIDFINVRLVGFEVEVAIEKLKRHKSPGIDQIAAELFKV